VRVKGYKGGMMRGRARGRERGLNRSECPFLRLYV
jgi:hypothetical protein